MSIFFATLWSFWSWTKTKNPKISTRLSPHLRTTFNELVLFLQLIIFAGLLKVFRSSSKSSFFDRKGWQQTETGPSLASFKVPFIQKQGWHVSENRTKLLFCETRKLSQEVVTQLAEWSFLTPEVRSSNPSIDRIFTIMSERTKNRGRECSVFWRKTLQNVSNGAKKLT